MRRSIADFRKEATQEPYEIVLEDGTVVPMRPSSEVSMDDVIRSGQYVWGSEGPTPLEIQVKAMAGEHGDAVWAEWLNAPRYAIDAIISDIDKHYDGVDDEDGQGKAGT